jgi:hypothetical protein
MSDDGKLLINSEWHLGARIEISGTLSGEPFANKGKITTWEPPCALAYEYQNSLSYNHYGYAKNDLLQFFLTKAHDGTILKFTCATGYGEVEEKHLRLYWGATLRILKEKIELLYGR